MKSYVKCLLLSVFVLVIFLIAIPQDNYIHTVASSVLVLFWIFPVFLIGVPTWKESVNERLQYLTPINIPIIYVFSPYFLLLISGGTGFESFFDLILWYLLPTMLFLIPELIQGNLEENIYGTLTITLNTIAALILWIGFDHRYTKTLFEGFQDLSYTLNAIWVACIVMVTFGRTIGIQQYDSEKDQGLVPTWYATKIANITTPIASLIVIPFGLLTGFLLWNPQSIDLTVIIAIIGIFLTIALQEELIFRGVLQQELTKLSFVKSDQIREYGVIVLVTIAFALTHWNNEVPEYVLHYFIAAFIAGLAYAVSYKKAGLFSAMLSHTLVDWVWALFLKRV